MELLTRLAHLLPHWIEHNTSHAEQFEEYASRALAEGFESIAGHIEAAAGAIRQSNEELERARKDMRAGED
jgi:hypothetical protein